MMIVAPNAGECPGRALFRAAGREFDEPVDFLWRTHGGKVVGGWAYTGKTADTVQMHIAGERGWLSTEAIRTGFEYPFDVLGTKVIIAAIPGADNPVLKIAVGLGFTVFGRLEEVDLQLLKMSRAMCRWITRG
jgi:hypothetical protein